MGTVNLQSVNKLLTVNRLLLENTAIIGVRVPVLHKSIYDNFDREKKAIFKELVINIIEQLSNFNIALEENRNINVNINIAKAEVNHGFEDVELLKAELKHFKEDAKRWKNLYEEREKKHREVMKIIDLIENSVRQDDKMKAINYIQYLRQVI